MRMRSLIEAILRRGFRTSKCNAQLKLTVERIKLLRRKREIRLKQARRDVAELLHLGHQATALSRVDLVEKEHNMLAAYDFIWQYCEIIATKIPVVRKHKSCPIELKEAISSLIYAASRCADLPELQKARHLFSLKYGKLFVMAAVELHPDSAVSSKIIEKLSGKIESPAEAKVALLREIAAEYDESTKGGSSKTEEADHMKTSNPYLEGPRSFISASQLHTLSTKRSSKTSPRPTSPVLLSKTELTPPSSSSSASSTTTTLSSGDGKDSIVGYGNEKKR